MVRKIDFECCFSTDGGLTEARGNLTGVQRGVDSILVISGSQPAKTEGGRSKGERPRLPLNRDLYDLEGAIREPS